MEERDARRLLRKARLIRRRYLPYFVTSGGDRAAGQLRAAAGAGDLVVLRLLAQGPDLLFGLACEELISGTELSGQLHRKSGPYPVKRYGPHPQVTQDLAQFVLHPGDDELTADMRRIVAVAAGLDSHPIAEIARRKLLAAHDQVLYDEVCELAHLSPALAEFCRQHELRPADPARRPLFWFLTRQVEPYRAEDPDGSLAATAYATADDDQRRRLRQAAIDLGLFHVLRRMTADEYDVVLRDEAQYGELSASMVRHERWQLLSELILQLPLSVAIARSRLLPPDWRSTELLTRLRELPPELASAAAADPAVLNLIRFERDPVLVAFGRSRAAVFSGDDDVLYLDVYDVPRGWLVAHREYETDAVPYEAVVCGDTVVFSDTEQLWHCTPDDVIPIVAAYTRDMVPTADGWVELSDDHLLIGSADGRLVRRVRLSELELDSSRPHFAVSADGTRIALAGDHVLVVLDQDGHRIGRGYSADPEPIRAVSFLDDGVLTAYESWTESRRYRVIDGNDFLQTWDDVEVHVTWYLSYWNDQLEQVRRPDLPTRSTTESYDDPNTHFRPYTSTTLPDSVLARDHRDPGYHPPPDGTQRRQHLVEIPGLPPRWDTPRNGCLVPGTTVIAVTTEHELRLYDVLDNPERTAVLALLNRRVTDLEEADVAAVREALLG